MLKSGKIFGEGGVRCLNNDTYLIIKIVYKSCSLSYLEFHLQTSCYSLAVVDLTTLGNLKMSFYPCSFSSKRFFKMREMASQKLHTEYKMFSVKHVPESL